MNRAILIGTLALLLAGCISINGVELSPTGITQAAIKGSIKKAGNAVRSLKNTARPERLFSVLEQYPPSSNGVVSNEVLDVIRTDYQVVLNDIVEEIRKIQKEHKNDGTVNKKGPIKDIFLEIVEEPFEINASAIDDVIRPTIRVPSGYIVQALQRLKAEHSESTSQTPGILAMFSGFTRYTPAIEFEEMMRFILAHEATHIWLHTPGMVVRDREIEADAWGALISSSLSDVLKFRAKSGIAAMSGGFSTSSAYEMSLMASRSGSDVLFYLYGESGVFSQETDRETLEERQASIEEKYSEAFSTYFDSVSTRDYVLWEIMRAPFK